MIRCQICKSHHGIYEVKVKGKETVYACPLCVDQDVDLKAALEKQGK